MTLSAKELLRMGRHVLGQAPFFHPDGSRIFFLGAGSGTAEYWAVAPEGGTPEQVTGGLGGMPFNRWYNGACSPDGRWLAHLSNKADRTGRGDEVDIWLHRLDGSNEDIQLTHMGAAINAMQWTPGGELILFSCNRYGSYDVYSVRVPDGRLRRLTDDVLHEVYPTGVPNEDRILHVRLNEAWTDHEIMSITPNGGDARCVATDENLFDYRCGRTFGHPLVSPGGETLLFPSQRSGWINYWRVPVSGDTDPEPLVPAEADQTEACWSPSGEYVAYIENYNGSLQLRVVSCQTGDVTVVDSQETGVCASPTWSPDGSQLAYLYQSPIEPLELRVADFESGNGLCVAETRTLVGPPPEARTGALVAPEKIHFESFDGLKISAYLYRPQQAGTRDCPGIMWIHGGPTSQFSDTFQPDVQFFAQRGYVVLLPNIRGSSGYGKHFEDLNNRDWGHGDLGDVLHGVRYLKSLDEVNPDAMAIHGTSYGGCMTMAAIAFAPGVFHAAAAHAGYGDWVEFYRKEDLQHVKLLDYEFGPQPENEHLLRRSSPMYHIRDIRTPTLILCGEGDLSPQSDASRVFAKEMERLHKPVRYRTYPGECYYVASTAGKTQMLIDMLDFFDQYLPGS